MFKHFRYFLGPYWDHWRPFSDLLHNFVNLMGYFWDLLRTVLGLFGTILLRNKIQNFCNLSSNSKIRFFKKLNFWTILIKMHHCGPLEMVLKPILIFSPIEIESNLHKWVVTKVVRIMRTFSLWVLKLLLEAICSRNIIHNLDVENLSRKKS